MLKHKLADRMNSLNPTGVYVNLQDLIRLRFAAKDLDLFSQKNVDTPLNGAQRTRLRGRGMEFEEVRLYQPGDDIRSIDWRVTARTQKPHTKLYQEERERPLLILVDQRSSMFFGSRVCFKSVMAAHLAATLAWTGLKQSDRIGGLVLSDQHLSEIKPRRSSQAVLQLLQRITELNQALKSPNIKAQSTPSLPTTTQQITLAQSLFQLRSVVKPGTSLFIISDFYDFNADCEQHLATLAKHASIQLIQVYDPLEKNLSNSQPLYASDGDESIRLESHQKSFQQAYEKIFSARTSLIKNFAQQNRVKALSISTREPLQEFLRNYFTH